MILWWVGNAVLPLALAAFEPTVDDIDRSLPQVAGTATEPVPSS